MSLAYLELNTLGPYFGLPEAASLNTVPVRSSSICVTRIAKDVADGERPIVCLPVCDAYFLMVYTKEAHHCDILPDGTRTLPRRFERIGLPCRPLRRSIHRLTRRPSFRYFFSAKDTYPRGRGIIQSEPDNPAAVSKGREGSGLKQSHRHRSLAL